MPKKIIFEDKTCIYCGLTFNRWIKNGQKESACDFRVRKFCSKKCFHSHNRKENHWLYKGGIKTRPDGYLRYSDTDEYVHRRVMEEFLGRKLTTEEHIHHINGNKSDNRVENLQLHTNSSHRQLHCESQIRDSKSGKFIKYE